jgi:hypothetical protein
MTIRRSQHFLFAPGELISWLRDVASDPKIWMAADWLKKGSAIISPEELRKEMFELRPRTDIPRLANLFLGSRELAQAPVWEIMSGVKLIDTRRSCCIQVRPPLVDISSRSVEGGYLAIFSDREYKAIGVCNGMFPFYRRIRRSMEMVSDMTIDLQPASMNVPVDLTRLSADLAKVLVSRNFKDEQWAAVRLCYSSVDLRLRRTGH